MQNNINNVIKKIIIENNDNSLFEIEEELEKIENINMLNKDIITEFLFLYEKNPDFDFGMPGALTHFLEKFYGNGYEEKLLKSIKRQPTKHTLWMLNRVINGTCSDEIKKSYIQEMYLIAKNNKLNISLRNLANEYIKFAHITPS